MPAKRVIVVGRSIVDRIKASLFIAVVLEGPLESAWLGFLGTTQRRFFASPRVQ
jgi:hypothetical protein